MSAQIPQSVPDIYGEVAGNTLLARLNVRGIFRRSVVWISSFSREEGARGLILNRPLGKNLGECSPFFAGTALTKIPMFCGGPVNEFKLSVLACIHDFETGGRALQFGLSPEKVRDYARDPAIKLVTFAGESVWSPKQLENEIASGTWFISKMNFEEWEKSATPDLWERILATSEKMDAQFMLRSPEDLSLN